MISLNGELGALYLKGLRAFDSLDDTEHVRFSSHLGSLFRAFEEDFFQWREGNLDPHHWRGYEADHDGDEDLIVYFDAQEAELPAGAREACLTGLLGGRPFEACEAI